MMKAVIIGAGPAGLTAGYELSKLGIGSTVLEADATVGGISRTVNYKNYRFDIGGHRFFTKVPVVNDLWQEMLGSDLLVRSRMSRIHYRGKYFDYPFKASNALLGLGPVESLLVGLSYTKARLFPSEQETNFEQWVSNRFGSRLYEIFFKTYTEKVWGIPCTEISADWAAQRIKNLSFQEALRSALVGAKKTKGGDVITSLIESFQYPRLGPGMMWERCEELLRAQGNETLRGVKVDRIRHRHGRVECVYGQTSAGEREEFAADQFISTMPLRKLMQSLDPLPPDEVLLAAERLRYRDYLTVVLVAKRESVFPDNWIYIHSPEVKMGRIQNYKNWSPEMVPDQSRTSLGLEYFLWQHDEEWNWSNERLIDLGIKECAQIGMLEPSEIEDGTVVRMKKAYPVYDQSYQANVDVVRNYLQGFSNLQTIGRNGLHRYNNQDHSMLTGIYAARNIAGEKNDVWSVNTEMEYHEEGRDKAATKHSGDRLVPQRAIPAPAGEHAVASLLLPDEIIARVFAKIDPIALGAAFGLVSGLYLFLATVVLLLKGGAVIGPTLSLLNNFFYGYEVTWTGALVGFAQACAAGFALGCGGASIRNWVMSGYAYFVRRGAEAASRRDLLDKV